jgi:hypothetical protein
MKEGVSREPGGGNVSNPERSIAPGGTPLLESLASQRAVVEQVISASGKLSFEAREAEGLIEALRQERELTQGIHDALKDLHQEDSDPIQVKFGTTEG